MRHGRLLTMFELGSLLVMLTLAGPAAAAEEAICSDPNVFFCENWEDRDVGPNDFTTSKGSKTLGWGKDQSPGQEVVTNGQVVVGQTVACAEGSKCFMQTYGATPGPFDNGGGGFIGTVPYPPQRTVYYRLWVKYPSNWVNSNDGSKLMYHQDSVGRLTVLTEVYNPQGYLPVYNIGYGPNLYPNRNQSAGVIRKGQWQCIESRLTAESTVGAKDGYYQAWVNDPAGGADIQVAEYPNLGCTKAEYDSNQTGATSFGCMTNSQFYGQSARIDGNLLSAYWNCVCDPSKYQCGSGSQTVCNDPQNTHPQMVRLVDRVVISRARVGCSGSSGTPSATVPAAPGQVQAR